MAPDRSDRVRLTPPPRPSAREAGVAVARPVARRAGIAAVLVAALGGLSIVLLRPAVEPARPADAAAAPATATAPAAAPVTGDAEAGAAEPEPPPAAGPAEVEPAPASRTDDAAAASAPPARAAMPATARVPAVDPDFTAAMSQALAALGTGDLSRARAALERARTIDPAAPAVGEALARLAERETAAALREALAAAAAHEAGENWTAAVADYDAALALDRGLAAAAAGRAGALERARLAERIESHIARPDRLLAPAVLAEAEALLEDATAIDPPGPCLHGQIERLGAILAHARTPVAVVLRSDQATAVTLLRHGVLGAFRERRIDLRPGAYVAVGSRPGYRDVRRRFEVVAGTPPEPIEVRCEERI